MPIKAKAAEMLHHAKELTAAIAELQGEEAANKLGQEVKELVKETVVKYDLDLDEVLSDAAHITTQHTKE